MVLWAAIQNLSDQIVRAFHPSRVVLFGSYASGGATDDSDVDIMVIFDGTESAPTASEVRRYVDVSFPLDLMVRTQPEIDRRVSMHDDFLREIVENGVVLYAAADGGVGNQGRSGLRYRESAGMFGML